MTYVTFKVEEVWKGAVGAVTQLEFLGGTIGDTTMEVVGMPTFREGQRSVLFVSPEVRAASPLVGFWHGRMRIERDPNGVDRVRTYDGRSLGDPSEVGAQPPELHAVGDADAPVRSRVRGARPRARREGAMNLAAHALGLLAVVALVAALSQPCADSRRSARSGTPARSP